jgi:hypothetical protein
MRIELLRNGLVDDLVVEATMVRLVRSGDARCRIEVQGQTDLEIEVWTTRKSRLLVRENESPPKWITPVARTGEDLDQVEATHCLVHLEQMDRCSYFLGLSREDDAWGLSLSSPAYTKARVVVADVMTDE